MNKPTAGPWVRSGFEVYGKNETPLVADCARFNVLVREEIQANIALIVAAVNGCFAVNPDNPLAVAEALPELVKACRGLTSQSKEVSEEEGKSINDWDLAYDLDPLRAALAKLEAK